MTNHRTKLEEPWAICSLVIDRTKFVYGPTDICKAIIIPPLLLSGHNNAYCECKRNKYGKKIIYKKSCKESLRIAAIFSLSFSKIGLRILRDTP